MKIKCWNCGHEFDGGVSLDELGWHSYCDKCETSFDVDASEYYKLYGELHNKLIKRLGIEADKYELQDSFGAVIDIMNGAEPKETLTRTFGLVYGVEIPDDVYNHCLEW